MEHETRNDKVKEELEFYKVKKTFRAYWKIEPTIETEEKDYPTEEEITDKLLDITMNPHDYIDFEEEKYENTKTN